MGTKPKDNRFNGRAIYQPSGAAAEYAKWACNLFNGCSNRCDYCYNRHSMTTNVLGADEVTLKKQLLGISKDGLLDYPVWKTIVVKEIRQNIESIKRDGGIFMSFVSDPMLPETIYQTRFVLDLCDCEDIPITILTKSAWWVTDESCHRAGHAKLLAQNTRWRLFCCKKNLSLGFTLTGMDDMERHCISNTQQRIDAMVWAKQNGIHTWASIEPVIDFDRAFEVIYKSFPFCDEYRIGLASKLGIKYDLKEVVNFVNSVRIMNWNEQKKIIWKKSIIDKIKQ